MPTVIKMLQRTTSLTLSNFPAPRFWPTREVTASPMVIAGIKANWSSRPPTPKAAVTDAPNLFTSDVMVSIPKDTMICCTPAGSPMPKVRRTRRKSTRQSSRCRVR